MAATPMHEVRLPLSGAVFQTFNLSPWPTPCLATPYVLEPPTVTVGRSTNAEIELEVLAVAGSYGLQLGRIGDVLSVLLKYTELPPDMTRGERRAILRLKEMLEEIADIKERHGAKNVLRPHWP